MNHAATQLRKLTLHRETLAPLQARELDDVNGGTGPLCASAIRLSIQYCSAISRSVLESAKYSCVG